MAHTAIVVNVTTLLPMVDQVMPPHVAKINLGPSSRDIVNISDFPASHVSVRHQTGCVSKSSKPTKIFN